PLFRGDTPRHAGGRRKPPSSPSPRRRRGPDTTLRFKRSASPGPLFRVGRNRGIFSVRTLLESGHADNSADRHADFGSGPDRQRPGGIVHLLDPWTGG